MTALALFVVFLAQVLALASIMAGAWIVQQRTGNSGWVDAVWTFGVGSVGAVSALIALQNSGEWPSARQMLVAILVGVWALRLGSHIVGRSATKADDPRYADLIEGWGDSARHNMFFLLQKQALVSVPLVLSMFIAAQNPTPGLGVQDVIGVLIFAIAIAGQTVADRQLRQFAQTRDPKQPVCNVGLWRYSRHPNYFFEWLHWMAYPVIAIDFSGGYVWGFLALAGALTMYWLLRHVSGVPPLEAHMVRKHGAAYRAYQSSTSAFFPWIPAHG